MTAGTQKIFHPEPTIGFLAKAKKLNEGLPALEQALAAARAAGGSAAVEQAAKAVRQNRSDHFNQVLDAAVAGVFLVLVTMILVLSIREWILLLARRRLATLHETEPVWLPDYALAQAKPWHIFSILALGIGLARELSGEAQIDRLERHQTACACRHGELDRQAPEELDPRRARQQAYLRMTEKRFSGVNRCC
jgi:carbon starvation protein